MDPAIKQETGVWFFTAYHILREGAKEALEKCAEGKADDAADILKDVLDDAEGFFMTASISMLRKTRYPTMPLIG